MSRIVWPDGMTEYRTMSYSITPIKAIRFKRALARLHLLRLYVAAHNAREVASQGVRRLRR